MKNEKTAVITDSCADVPEDLRKRYNIFILPIPVHCEEGEYRDGVDITSEIVYEKQKTEMLKTSSPTGEDVLRTFEEVKRQGYRRAVMILLSGGLSGTVGAMRALAGREKELEVRVYDSLEASIGIGAIAIQTAKYIEEGVGFDELDDKIRMLIRNTQVFFSINTLEYLYKGGRIGKITKFAGTILKIKPVLSFDKPDGQIYLAAMARGGKQVQSSLLKLVSGLKDKCRRFNLMIADGGAPEELVKLEARVKELFPGYESLFKAKIGAALSVYLGSGLLGAGIQFLD